MIPAEAVEAAARKLCALGGYDWDMDAPADVMSDFRAQLLTQARELLEAAAPHMLATVSTVAELDGLPRFTVIRSDEGAVFERQTMWHEAGSRDLMYSPDIALPATVLQLGWGEE